MRKLILIAFLVVNTAFGGICIKKVENPGTDPYLNYVLLQKIEQAVLEAGKHIDCSEGSKELIVRIERLRDIPIAISPEQRVTNYILEVIISLSIDKREHRIQWSVPYEQLSGLEGDLPRREAFEDALDKIFIEVLDFLKGG